MIRYSRQTLIVNFDQTPIRLTHWTKAIKLIFKGKATQIDFYKDDVIKDGHGKIYSVPAVVILNRYIRRNYQRAPLTKNNIVARDNLTCGYCERVFKRSDLTIDHIIPRSRWKGKSSPHNWMNVVTACYPCNKRKADRTCEESGMYPNILPTQPSYEEIFMAIKFNKKFEPEWEKYFAIFPTFRLTHA